MYEAGGAGNPSGATFWRGYWLGGRYRANPVVIDGHRFASGIEATRYGELRLLERAGDIKGLVCHPPFKVSIGSLHFCTYTADFAYQQRTKLKRFATASGPLYQWLPVVEEVKSKATRKETAYRLRRKAAELFHGITVIEVVR